MSAIETKMSEEQAINLVRNSLLVAGMEMGGTDGDHWPVIKSTIHTLAKDWEEIKTERAVSAEVKKHYETMLRELDALRKGSPDAFKIDLDIAIGELQEIYDALFSKVGERHVDEDNLPHYIKQAKFIIDTLEGEDDA